MTGENDMVKEYDELLRSLINTLIDGQEGYKTLGDDLKDAELKGVFLGEAKRRAAFRNELERLLHQIDIKEVDETGTIIGTVHRTWGDLKAKLGGPDKTLLESAVQGDEAATHAYKQALERELVLPIRQVLVKQQAHIDQTLAYLQTAAENLT